MTLLIALCFECLFLYLLFTDIKSDFLNKRRVISFFVDFRLISYDEFNLCFSNTS